MFHNNDFKVSPILIPNHIINQRFGHTRRCFGHIKTLFSFFICPQILDI